MAAGDDDPADTTQAGTAIRPCAGHSAVSSMLALTPSEKSYPRCGLLAFLILNGTGGS